MRRALTAALIACAFPALARAQDSTAARPTFHGGQWAAQFAVSGGFYGLGAIHFTSPSNATIFTGSLHLSYAELIGSNNHLDSESFGVGVGRRWYRPGAGRVRPYSGLGVTTSYGRRHQSAGSVSYSDQSLGAGVTGQIGAAVFFAPELSLGASWGGSLSGVHYWSNSPSTPSLSQTNLDFSVGNVFLEGAFYF